MTAVRTSEAPPFWWEKPDWRAYALWPASFVYGAVAGRRMRTAVRAKVDAPVLCVGNFTVGGTGKTPVAIALAKAAEAKGLKPGILSRGHGGSFSEPHLVDAAHDLARLVGDEPLLLAQAAPVAVTADRRAGAELLLAQGCDFLIMDDGFQSARIHIDYALLVVDSARGIGNGHVIPGGPLRAPLVAQMRHADALLKMGEGTAGDWLIRQAARAGRPILEAETRPLPGTSLAGRRFLAFAGIGHTAKFFDTIKALGGELAATRDFADHHAYADDELEDLMATAARQGAELATTAKDAARLRGSGAVAARLLQRLTIVEVETVFDNPAAVDRLLDATREAFRVRRLAG